MPFPKAQTNAKATTKASTTASSTLAIGVATVFIFVTAILSLAENHVSAVPSDAMPGWTLRGHLDDPGSVVMQTPRA